LREMLSRPAGEHRLAVLAACDTNVPDLDLVDEVVSLPGGLLRAGAAGVVAPQWPVDDTAAALLVLRFHECFARGMPPNQALAAAQAWLRSADRHELHVASPELVREPVGLPAPAIEVWRRRRPYQHPLHWAAFTFTGA
jgi:CHAT domain-containing protein